jgi:hypothetical protein
MKSLVYMISGGDNICRPQDKPPPLHIHKTRPVGMPVSKPQELGSTLFFVPF